MTLGFCDDGPGGREGLSAVRELSPAAILNLPSDDQMTSIKDTKSNKGFHWLLNMKFSTNKRVADLAVTSMFVITKHT